MTILQRIFKNHFDTVASSGITIRDTVFENVEKMLHCGDYRFGYALYVCKDCGRFHRVPFVVSPVSALPVEIFTQ